jgi:hypothetical protein
MQAAETFISKILNLAPEEDLLVASAMEQHSPAEYRALSPELRQIAIETASRVAAMSREQLDFAIKAVDEITGNDPFLNRDNIYSLANLGNDVVQRGENFEKKMKSALAMRIARRRLADHMKFDPSSPESYWKITNLDDFRNTCNFVHEAMTSLL